MILILLLFSNNHLKSPDIITNQFQQSPVHDHQLEIWVDSQRKTQTTAWNECFHLSRGIIRSATSNAKTRINSKYASPPLVHQIPFLNKEVRSSWLPDDPHMVIFKNAITADSYTGSIPINKFTAVQIPHSNHTLEFSCIIQQPILPMAIPIALWNSLQSVKITGFREIV